MATATAIRKVAEETSNPFGLPRGEMLRRAVVGVFYDQRRAILRFLQTGRKDADSCGYVDRWGRSFEIVYRKDQAGNIPFAWPDWHDFGLGALSIARRMTAMIRATWDAAGAKFTSKIGLDPDNWSVTNPHLARMIDSATLHFCDATNRTTSLALDEALRRTWKALHEGVVKQGESVAVLTDRVQEIFDQAERWRARRIAQTETSRAVHAAQEQAAIQGEVVTGWEWMASADACPICIAIMARARYVRLGEAFAVIGDDPYYSEVRFPPAHPHCMCTMVEILDTDPQPRFANTLRDPEPATAEEAEAVAAELTGRYEEILHPKPKPKKPKPARKPKPVVARVPKKPKWVPGEVIEPTLPISERIKLSPAWAKTEALANEPFAKAKQAVRDFDEQLKRLTDATSKLKASQLSEEEKAGYLAEFDRLTKAREEARKARDKAQPQSAEVVAAILSPPKGVARFKWDVEWSTEVAFLPTKANRHAAAEAEKFVGDILVAGPGKSGDKMKWHSIPVGQKQRSNCVDFINSTYLSQAADPPVAVHEWGHQIEHSVPGVRASTEEFLAHRVGNEPLRKLMDVRPGMGYEAHEEGREDDFRKAFGDSAWYVGKHYRGGSEIISMGLEKLYTDPGGFAREDPEYCTFIVGILDGSLRKP